MITTAHMSLFSVTQILVAAVLSLLAFVVYKHRHKRYMLPPGPMGFPVVGCIPLLDKAAPYKSMTDLGNKYGGVFMLRMGTRDVVVLHGYDAIKEAFITKCDTFKGRPRMVLSDLIAGGRGIVFSTHNENYREQRNFAVSALKSFGWGSSAFEVKVMREVNGLIEAVQKFEGKPFDPFHYVRNSVCNIIFSIIFGRRFRHDDQDFRNLLTIHYRNMRLCGAASAVNFIPILQYLPFGNFKRVLKNHIYLRTCQIEMIEKHRQTHNPTDIRDFLDLYIQEIEMREKKGQASSFDYDNIRRVANDLFTVGTETTATTILWSLLYMITYPNIQKRIQKELFDVLGDRLPTIDDKPKLPFVEATIMEVQRSASVLPLTMPHCAMEDTELYGYHIPKDTMVMANLWSVLHDPKHWENPEEFRPERFLNENGEVEKPEMFIPFSTGARMCLGDQTAKMELFLFFACLMQTFSFTRPEGTSPPTLVGKTGITLSPQPFEVCAHPRVR
ncbi:cytochrome P450 2U1-like [Saccoglossus kowalevskii]|uniref:Cytochrome P450 2U1-like n=1 Tax=Saccoglossus kowalevskii TaxID=10224 RepID=A0ABM0GWB8_SACKO|nr:PREDICTED: cytochrome P450 2U1-like [Saccoglossus kowalevskii]